MLVRAGCLKYDIVSCKRVLLFVHVCWLRNNIWLICHSQNESEVEYLGYGWINSPVAVWRYRSNITNIYNMDEWFWITISLRQNQYNCNVAEYYSVPPIQILHIQESSKNIKRESSINENILCIMWCQAASFHPTYTVLAYSKKYI